MARDCPFLFLPALEAPPSSMGAPAHLHLKGQTQKWGVLAHTLKVALLPLSAGYFELKLHIQDIRDLFYIL